MNLYTGEFYTHAISLSLIAYYLIILFEKCTYIIFIYVIFKNLLIFYYTYKMMVSRQL